MTVVNEIDDANYPPEKMIYEHIPYIARDGRKPEGYGGFNFYITNLYAPMRSTATGPDGHTALPKNKENTVIISDFIQNKEGKKKFIYTVTASKDGQTAAMSGLDIDESWYRENPNMPTKTVIMVLGGQSYLSNDTISPTISIVTPQGRGKVFGVVPIEVNVSDNYGVSRVEFYVDEVLVNTFTSSPYKWLWDTKDISEGGHTIKIVAYDGNENRSEKVINVTVTKVSGIVVYPNPYIKGKGVGDKISFANLPKEATINIYTAAGELLKTIEHKDSVDGGKEEWDVSDTSSGIYLYVVTSAEGTKKGKVSIIK